MPDDKEVVKVNETYSWIEKFGRINEACGDGDGWPPVGWQWHGPLYPSEFSPPWEDWSENVYWHEWAVDDKYFDLEGEWICTEANRTVELKESYVYNCVPDSPPPWSYKYYHLSYEMTCTANMEWVALNEGGGIIPALASLVTLLKFFDSSIRR